MFAETKGDKGPLRIVGPSPVEALLTSETKKCHKTLHIDKQLTQEEKSEVW